MMYRSRKPSLILGGNNYWLHFIYLVAEIWITGAPIPLGTRGFKRNMKLKSFYFLFFLHFILYTSSYELLKLTATTASRAVAATISAQETIPGQAVSN
jgi:glycopeptide antibiotics resistance protein